MKEVWKDIKEYNGLYQISNLGKVKSLGKKSGNGSGYYERKAMILKFGYDKGNYQIVGFSKQGELKTFTIHRLVGLAFIPNPLHKKEINHIDGDKTNNHVSNLEWVTHQENMQHAFKIGIVNNNNFAKAVLMLDLNNNPLVWFDSILEAERQTKINNSSIVQCCKGRLKTAGKYKWSYYKEEEVISKN